MQYRWTLGKTIRLNLTAKLKGSLPILQNPEPVDLEGSLRVSYLATPAKQNADGQTVVQFRAENAEAEVLGIPISVPMEDAHKILDRVVTFAPTGEVVRVEQGAPLPFSLSIPGVDPQRLYALLCPVVFPATPLAVGESWDYQSELLGAEGNPARFSARVLAVPSASSRGPGELRIEQTFTMDVDQMLDADNKPVSEGAVPARSRKGTITGNGIMVFDPSAGRLLRGHLTIQAEITERPVKEPATDGTGEIVSKVKAVIQVAPQLHSAVSSKPRPTTGVKQKASGKKRK